MSDGEGCFTMLMGVHRCGLPVVADIDGMCVHEHLRASSVCQSCLDRGRRGLHICRECRRHPTEPHSCQLTLVRVKPLAARAGGVREHR